MIDSSQLRLLSITKRFGAQTILQNITFSIDKGRILCLLGPSGSGKTTLLRIIAGLDQSFLGELRIRGENQQGVPPRERDIGFVFQTTEAVFPHLTVFQNILFPLQLKLRRDQHQNNNIKMVNKMLDRLGLSSLSHVYPDKLSGGERQRVALARALIYEPSLLLLDEPLTFLDANLKRDFLQMILDMHADLNLTIVYVTHDEREALQIADDIILLNRGAILQAGNISDVVRAPCCAAVAQMLGGWNIVRVTIDPNNRYHETWNHVLHLLGDESALGSEIDLGIPLSAITVDTNGPFETTNGLLTINGTIQRVTPWYGQLLATVDCIGTKLMVEVKDELLAATPGQSVNLRFSLSTVRKWAA